MIKYVAILLLMVTFVQGGHTQNLELAKTKIAHLDSMLDSDQLSDKAYLDSVGAWRWSQLSSGVLFDAGTLIHYLKNYKKIAWDSDKFLKQRINYFDFLATNARMQTRSGEALYFYGKLEAELERQTGNKSLYQLSEQCNYYIYPKQYDKVIAAYEKGNGYKILETYPAKIRTNSLDTVTAFRYVYVVMPVCIAYAHLGDSVNYNKTMRIAQSIGQELVKKISPKSSWAFTIKFETDNLDLYRNLYMQGNANAALSVLRKQLNYLSSDTIQQKGWKQILEQKTLEDFIEAFLLAAQYDSATHYIGELEQYGVQSPETDLKIYLAKSKIAMSRGDYKMALEYERKANEIKEVFNFTLLNETQEILYAHAEAEYNRSELAQAEREKRVRLNWIIGIGLLAIAIVVAGYVLARRQKRNFNFKLKKLNEITDIQIAEVEREAAKNEQQRLGQDLHDELSASLAAITHQIGLVESQAENSDVKQRLANVNDNARRIYETVRAKSHYLYQSSGESLYFESQIKKVADSALPDTAYSKEIDVDNIAASGLNAAQRIELLRILQEAMSNIVKHAKKVTEVFIFFYKKDDACVLEIGDNGLNTATANREGIGLKSIKDRIKRMNGTIEIDDRNGMVLKMQIPVATSNE